jgi:amino acid adenylation domain-containing protein
LNLTEGIPAASLANYLEASAIRFANRVAVVDPDGTQVTYNELNERADRVAAYLAGHNVGPGDRVGLLLPKCVEAVIAIFGTLKARAAYVPIDWTTPATRAGAILADCKTRAIIAEPGSFARLDKNSIPSGTVILAGPSAHQTTSAIGRKTVHWEEVLRNNLPRPSRSGQARSDLAYILYTSGSTGVPKGVMLSHGNGLSFVDWCSSVFEPNEEDRFSSHAPFHFDLSILDLFAAVKHGASVHLIDDQTGRTPKELARLISQRELTVWYSTPSILHLLATYGQLGRYDFSKLRLVLFAGEVFPIKHLRQLTELWPKPRYYNLYGPTETNVCTYALVPSRIPEGRIEPYPIGWPCAHCSAEVLDVEGRPAPKGSEGVLHIAGESVFRGYWDRPEESRAVFLIRGGQRWYSTGDVVREDAENGFVFLGRRDRMVKRHGYRIELDDIECALYRHEQIREAAVVAVTRDFADVKIVAYLVAAPGRQLGFLHMKAYCAGQLPAYMNPDNFVCLEKLPRTSTNKVDYQSLTRLFQSQLDAKKIGQ